MMNLTDTPPFDPDFDANNPYITEVPERFVYDGTWDDDYEEAYGYFAECIFDPER
jgi:hypothetical protein